MVLFTQTSNFDGNRGSQPLEKVTGRLKWRDPKALAYEEAYARDGVHSGVTQAHMGFSGNAFSSMVANTSGGRFWYLGMREGTSLRGARVADCAVETRGEVRNTYAIVEQLEKRAHLQKKLYKAVRKT